MIEPMEPIDAVKHLCGQYFFPFWKLLRDATHDQKATPAKLLVNPEKIVFYLGKTHIGVEYLGSSNTTESIGVGIVPVEFHQHTDKENLLDVILGFDYDATLSRPIRLPLIGLVEGIIAPTMEASDFLSKNGWDLDAQMRSQNSILPVNLSGFHLVEDELINVRNCFFYALDSKKKLIVRNVKWLDLYPIKVISEDKDTTSQVVLFPPDTNAIAVSFLDYRFPTPPSISLDKLTKLNRFIELFNQADVSETDITRFLSEPQNQIILKMAFAAVEIHSERVCEWAEPDKKAIKPDFLVVSDGFADIVEFKLPDIKNKSITGTENRETFSAEINKYISQTRVYKEYFEDPRNREYVKQKHKIEVSHPRRILVVGRRHDIPRDKKRKLEYDYKDLTIRTYDDIVDAVSGLLYALND